MPAEIRHLVFTSEEIVSAIRAYNNWGDNHFPASAAVEIMANDVNYPVVRITLPSGNNASRSEYHFSGKQLISPLLLYCSQKKIPMPARGTKDLTITRGHLTLVVSVLKRGT